MIKKFKDFFKKKQQIDIDYDELKLFVYDVIQPLSDINGINIIKSNTFVQKDMKFFNIKYTVNLSDLSDSTISELKSELKNCKSHLESEDLDLQIHIIDWTSDRDDIFTTKTDIDYINNELERFRIIIGFKT